MPNIFEMIGLVFNNVPTYSQYDPGGLGTSCYVDPKSPYRDVKDWERSLDSVGVGGGGGTP